MRLNYSRTRPTSNKKFIYSFLFVLFIGIILKLTVFDTPPEIISPLGNGNDKKDILRVIFEKKPRDFNNLISSIKKLLENEKGIYSVYIYDISKKTGVGINESTIFTAASVNKIPVLAALYFQAQKGEIDLDKRITIQKSDIQDFGTGIIRYQGAGSVYSIKSLAQVMMEKSDNTAVFVLTNLIGAQTVQNLVNDWGMMQTDIANNKTSNQDLSRLMIKMFEGKVANEAFTQEMLGFMDDSDFENRLPALLPKTVKVYHKIGNEIGNIHDVGIVALNNRPYYIGVLTNDITDEQSTENLIAQISKITYDFVAN